MRMPVLQTAALGVLLLLGCDGTGVQGAPELTIGQGGNWTFDPPGAFEVPPGLGGFDPLEAGEALQDDGSGGAPATSLSSAICDKLKACDSFEGEVGEQSCQAAVAGISAFVLEPEEFARCFTSYPCRSLSQDGIRGALLECLDLDPLSATCVGSDMSYCTNSGACGQVSCAVLCSGFGQEEGHYCVEVEGYSTCACMMFD